MANKKPGNGKAGPQVSAPEAQAPQQNQVQIGPQQIKAAAAAGAELLADKDLKVPLASASQLNLLQGLLSAVVRGELVVVGAEEAAKFQAPPTPDAPSSGDRVEDPPK